MHPLVTHCLGVIAVHKIKLYFRFETSLEVIHSPTKFRNTVLILAQGKVEKNSSSYFCIRYIKWYYKCCETDQVCLHCSYKFPYSHPFSSSSFFTFISIILMMPLSYSQSPIMGSHLNLPHSFKKNEKTF